MARLMALLIASLATGIAGAQPYPSKPVNVILPLQAGSASDVAVRILLERMSQSLGQQFLVENVAAGAGIPGTARAARATPDGYALAALNNSILSIQPAVQPQAVPFEATRDFVPITSIATIPTLLAVNRDVDAKTVRDLVALAKRSPGQLNYASGGAGSPQHLATEMFASMAGVKLNHIPYKGATQAATDLASGQVQVMFIAHSLAIPHLPSGRVRPIAFAGERRSAAFPDLPTVAESGIAGYDYSSWIALFAPAGTPGPIVSRLREESSRIIGQQETRERLAKSGLEVWVVAPEELPEIVRRDLARWRKVVADAGIRPE